eukprot:CAMPEP_0176087020 /NCGR_PEP_ID=MMETSP0120_2-20121206/43562_1 /TAXON_ID=160619 /ORGANISM="Kryptoperidinium foliaceum, Strain CCMP 1326" /LENGTH=126 /DNA_ID=CAMNT_0017420857 /DNA_START=229 /DNA_END=605 /DNA_ORIENTATION=-
MTDVALPLPAGGTTTTDASDLVDAMDAVDLVDAPSRPDDHDDDFQHFKGAAQTLEGETVADARLAAAAKVAEGDTPVVDNPQVVVAKATEAAATMELPLEATSSKDPRKRFVTPKDFELLKVIGMG